MDFNLTGILLEFVLVRVQVQVGSCSQIMDLHVSTHTFVSNSIEMPQKQVTYSRGKAGGYSYLALGLRLIQMKALLDLVACLWSVTQESNSSARS